MHIEQSPQQRVQALRNLTPADLKTLRKMCQKHIFHPTLAEDAFAHALAAAWECYDGRVPLKYYIDKVARNYAVVETHVKDAHATQFADLPLARGDGNRGRFEDRPSIADEVPDPRDFFPRDDVAIEWAKKLILVLKDKASDHYLDRGARINARRAVVILSAMLHELDEQSPDGDPHPTEPPLSRAEAELRWAQEIANAEGTALLPAHSTVQMVMAYLRRQVWRFLPPDQRRLLRSVPRLH